MPFNIACAKPITKHVYAVLHMVVCHSVQTSARETSHDKEYKCTMRVWGKKALGKTSVILPHQVSGMHVRNMGPNVHRHTKSVLNTQKDIQSEELRRDPDGLDHDFRGIINFLLNMHTHTEYVMIQSTSNTSWSHPPPSCIVYKQQTRATTKATLQLNKAAL